MSKGGPRLFVRGGNGNSEASWVAADERKTPVDPWRVLKTVIWVISVVLAATAGWYSYTSKVEAAVATASRHESRITDIEKQRLADHDAIAQIAADVKVIAAESKNTRSIVEDVSDRVERIERRQMGEVDISIPRHKNGERP